MTVVQEPEPTGTEEVRTVAGAYLIEGVYALILCVTVSAWAVVGFLVWFPLLVRITSILAATVLYANYFGDHHRVVNARRALHFASKFYVRGFEHFLTFYRQRHDPDPPPGLFEPVTEMRWRELLVRNTAPGAPSDLEVAVWQHGSERLARELDGMVANLWLIRLLLVGLPALAIAAGLWCRDAGHVAEGQVIRAALLFCVAVLIPGHHHQVRRMKAFLESTERILQAQRQGSGAA